jgi:hypothetical protein
MVLQKGAHTLAQATAHLARALTLGTTQDPAATHGQETHRHHTEGRVTPSQATRMNLSQATHTNRSHMR